MSTSLPQCSEKVKHDIYPFIAMRCDSVELEYLLVAQYDIDLEILLLLGTSL